MIHEKKMTDNQFNKTLKIDNLKHNIRDISMSPQETESPNISQNWTSKAVNIYAP